MMSTAGQGGAGPVGLAERASVPDLARGAMLLLIALAHAPGHLHDQVMGRGGYPVGGTAVDQGVVFAEVTVVVGRVYPMFAALMGYGLAQLWSRQVEAGHEPVQVRRLVRRRGAWLVVFGAVHAGLLFAGDILGAYGVITILLGAGLLRVPGRVVAGLTALSLAVVAVGGALTALTDVGDGTSGMPSTGESDVWAAAVLRLGEWAPSLLLQPFGMLGAVLMGVWAHRRRLLEQPDQHVAVLRRVAGAGLALAFAGGLPHAAIVVGWWAAPSPVATAVAGGLHSICGYGGVAYVAAVALVVRRSGSLPGAARRALAACGRRSLTCYLLQSVTFVAVLAAYGGGLGARMGTAAAAGIAVAAWLLTVVVAAGFERAGVRGPAETVLRRLTYR